MKENNPTDITKYITDITYEDEKGWISIITGNYKSELTKKDNNTYNIKLNVTENIEELIIEIDENIIIE